MGCGWLLISIMGVPVLSGKSSNWGWPDKNVESHKHVGWTGKQMSWATIFGPSNIWISTMKFQSYQEEWRVHGWWGFSALKVPEIGGHGWRQTQMVCVVDWWVCILYIYIYIYRYTSVRLFMYILKWLYIYIYMLMQHNYPFYTHYTPTGHCSR